MLAVVVRREDDLAGARDLGRSDAESGDEVAKDLVRSDAEIDDERWRAMMGQLRRLSYGRGRAVMDGDFPPSHVACRERTRCRVVVVRAS